MKTFFFTFHEFQGPPPKFRDFPGPKKKFSQFQDFLGFSRY